MKRFFIALLLVILPLLVNAQGFSLLDYFYPMQKFQYTTPMAGNQSSFIRTEYKISNSNIGQFLETTTDLYQNVYRHTTTAQAAYVLSKDDKRNAIVSDKQVYYYNMLTGPQNRTDHLILFILPSEGKFEKWFETNREEKYSCTAEYVEIVFDGFQLGQKATAVKITKITRVNGEDIKTWSYWLPNYSRIASFQQFGKGDVRIKEVSDMIDSSASIKEITKSLDLSYEEPQRKTTTKKRR